MVILREEGCMSKQSGGSVSQGAQPVRRVVVRKKQTQTPPTSKVWSDPMVRMLAAAIALVLIGALLTLIFALVNGSLSLTDAPADETSAAISRARAELEADPSAETYGRLIVGLGQSKRFSEAYSLLEEGRNRDFDQTRTQALEFAYGSLLAMEGKDDQAVEVLVKVMDDLKNAFESELARGDDQNWAMANGMPENYMESAHTLALIYEKKGQDDDALKMYDAFLKYSPLAADILIARGNLKLKMDDKKGALADFSEALRFVPDSTEAKDGIAQAEGK